ncbi:MAG: hypothetical protein DLM69_03560 [Candidatus Chloroheliales bacterium]|nr:MAG: hypothetical protein DLM69_03560 [Chloroflexota bacterium]
MADTMIRTSTRTIKGALRAVDLERNTCQIFTAKGKFVNCVFDESLEWQIKDALDCEVEATGEVITPYSNGSNGSRKAEWLRIEKVEMIGDEDGDEEFDFEAAGLKPFTGKDLLESGLIGMWKDRTDMDDSNDFARRLRELEL